MVRGDRCNDKTHIQGRPRWGNSKTEKVKRWSSCRSQGKKPESTQSVTLSTRALRCAHSFAVTLARAAGTLSRAAVWGQRGATALGTLSGGALASCGTARG